VILSHFRVRRSRGEMYSGHGRLFVCVSDCLSLAAFPQHCTNPDVNWGNGTGCPLVVHYKADLLATGARVSLLWQHSAEREMSASACTRSMPSLAIDSQLDSVFYPEFILARI